MRRTLCLALIASAASPLAAQHVVTSPNPDKVAVSIYRDPDRENGGINLDNLNGFALISETRTIDLPAGEADIRFEGVADGILSVSAIVTGLPGDTVQKNRDAALLAPASLVDGSLGNRVMLRRTDRATGAVREEFATVRSSAAGAVVMETATGYETLRCTGLSETLVYNGVPAGLSAKPTLSVRTRSVTAGRAQVTLTYLATGFDWAANYVADLSDDGKRVDLLAWMTVANGNGVSFADASLNALAGSVNVDSDYQELGTPPRAAPLELRCFATASGRAGRPNNAMDDAGEIVVTGMRRAPGAPMAMAVMESASPVAVVAEMEALGDLKLYRVPMATTIAANAQKQVALLVKDDVPVRRLYQITVTPSGAGEYQLAHLLRLDNGRGKGLGEPLPAGQVVLFEQAAGARRFAGAAMLRDHAVGETVNMLVGLSSQVRLKLSAAGADGQWTGALTNANPFAVDVEVRFDLPSESSMDRALARLPRKDGYLIWSSSIPANGTRTLNYRLGK